MVTLEAARPLWFRNLDRSKKLDSCLANKYFIMQAALFAGPDTTIRGLADAIGVSETGLRFCYRTEEPRGNISPRLALALQKLVGEEFMPVSLLRPDLF